MMVKYKSIYLRIMWDKYLPENEGNPFILPRQVAVYAEDLLVENRKLFISQNMINEEEADAWEKRIKKEVEYIAKKAKQKLLEMRIEDDELRSQILAKSCKKN